jgi:putative transposase
MEQQDVHKTYKFRLMTTPPQELDTILARCQKLYNVALKQRKICWQRGQGKTVTYYQQALEVSDLKARCPKDAEINAQVLQDVLRRLDKAFQSFFRRIQAGDAPGYPRFQGVGRYQRVTYPQFGGGAVLDGGTLIESKVGSIRVRADRPLAGNPTTVTTSREADGWYACVSCADALLHLHRATGQETGRDLGLDLGLDSLATLADGATSQNPRFYRKAERRLKRCQRQVSQPMKGSDRRRKAVKLLAKAPQKVRRQRRDIHHKEVVSFVRQYDRICYEDLQTANMVKDYRLAKSISDAGSSAFLTILAFKAAWAGKRAVTAPPAFTSQLCSGPDCGRVVWKGISARWHSCPDCGASLHRDHNAARNIQALGKKKRGDGQAPQAST